MLKHLISIYIATLFIHYDATFNKVAHALSMSRNEDSQELAVRAVNILAVSQHPAKIQRSPLQGSKALLIYLFGMCAMLI